MKKAFFLLFLTVSLSSFGQSTLEKKAEKSFSRFDYANAAALYEKILKKNPADLKAKVRLGQCQRYLKARSDWRNQPANKHNYAGANVPAN